ncbi:MAG: class I SAM-dependent methyltransferase [bacterium]|nr:class I SAM-dependent methyltransferase [bacterium]
MTESLRKKFDSFWENQAKQQDKYLATHFKKDSTHERDFEFIRKYTSKQSRILDMAAGTCIVTSRLAPTVKHITAVDKFQTFLDECPPIHNITCMQGDIQTMPISGHYDIILLFGIMNYFTPEEAGNIYQKYAKHLNKGGLILIKHQCGVNEDILIDTYSEQLGRNYSAFYRSTETELKLLAPHFNSIETIDIYPPELNRWENTHFYAFVCRKNAK